MNGESKRRKRFGSPEKRTKDDDEDDSDMAPGYCHLSLRDAF
jgi:hypothetical protein